MRCFQQPAINFDLDSKQRSHDMNNHLLNWKPRAWPLCKQPMKLLMSAWTLLILLLNWILRVGQGKLRGSHLHHGRILWGCSGFVPSGNDVSASKYGRLIALPSTKSCLLANSLLIYKIFLFDLPTHQDHFHFLSDLLAYIDQLQILTRASSLESQFRWLPLIVWINFEIGCKFHWNSIADELIICTMICIVLC